MPAFDEHTIISLNLADSLLSGAPLARSARPMGRRKKPTGHSSMSGGKSFNLGASLAKCSQLTGSGGLRHGAGHSTPGPYVLFSCPGTGDRCYPHSSYRN